VVKGKSRRMRMQSSLPKENRTLWTNFLDVPDLICGQGYGRRRRILVKEAWA
jgi:hypothetical protein